MRRTPHRTWHGTSRRGSRRTLPVTPPGTPQGTPPHPTPLVLALAALVFVGAALTPGRARAGTPPVALEIDPCVSVEPARLTELLQLELTVLTGADANAAPPTTRARIGCDGDAVSLSVFDDSGVAPTERRLDWAAYPPGGRPRLLALALSEMIARRWKDATVAPAPAPAATPVPARPTPAPSEMPPGRSEAEARPVAMGLVATIERVGRPPITTAGLDLILLGRVRPWLTVLAGGRAAAGSFDTVPGRVSLHTLSVMLAGLFGLTHGRFQIGAGPGVRGGWAWLRGQPDTGAGLPTTGQTTGLATGLATGRALNAAWWGPMLVGAGALRITGHVSVLLNLEAGFVARPVVGDLGSPTGAPAPTPAETVALDRHWLAGSAGLAWRF